MANITDKVLKSLGFKEIDQAERQWLHASFGITAKWSRKNTLGGCTFHVWLFQIGNISCNLDSPAAIIEFVMNAGIHKGRESLKKDLADLLSCN